MLEYFSIMEEVSKRVNRPYFSESETRFILEKNNIYIEVRFSSEGIHINGWVGTASLCLDADKFSDFLVRLRELKAIDITARSIRVETNPYSSEFSRALFPMFPRVRYSLSMGMGPKWPKEDIVDYIEGAYKVLAQVGNIVDEFRADDKSFESLNKLWNRSLISKNSTKKGKLLEEFLSRMISKDENFVVVERNLRTKSEELDIVLENSGKTQFYSQMGCPLILLECKNWSSKIGSKEIRDFAQKVQNRPRHLCSVGVLVTTSKLTRDAIHELLGYRGKDFVIATLERKDIKTILSKKLPFGDVLKEAIRKAGLR
jgi:hypothetical protein